MNLVPAPGKKIPDPEKGGYIPEAGREIKPTNPHFQYFKRRVADGDLIDKTEKKSPEKTRKEIQKRKDERAAKRKAERADRQKNVEAPTKPNQGDSAS